MNNYYPGTGVRSFMVSVDLSGNPLDPTSPSVLVTFPDGSTTTPTPVQDSVGQWHADFLIPFTMTSNVGDVQWRSQGALVPQNAVAKEKFFVNPLAP